MKNILIPVDHEGCSQNAVLYAIEIARAAKSDITLLHIQESPDFNTSEDEQERALMKKYETLAAHAGNIRAISVLSGGSVHDSILQTANEMKADLIVMGTTGAGDMGSEILGSVTGAVIADAECPVLAIPCHHTFHLPKRITFATDYHKADIKSLRYILDFAGNDRAQVNFLHISPTHQDPEKEVKEMKEFMEEVEDHVNYSNLSFQITASDSIQEQLHEYLARQSADMLVMSTRHKGSWRRIFDPGLTRTIAEEALIPLLTFHHQNYSSVRIF